MKSNLRILIILLLTVFLTLSSFSLMRAQENLPVDSPYSVTQSNGKTVKLDETTLFIIQTKQGALSPEKRAERISLRLQEFAKDEGISVDKLEIYEADQDGIPLTTISADNYVIIAISDADARIAGKTRRDLAQEYTKIIKEVVGKYRQERSLGNLIRAAIFSVIATVILMLTLFILNNIFRRIYQKLKSWEETYIRPIYLGNLELIRANQLDNLITLMAKIIQAVTILGLLVVYFSFVLRQFAWTRGLARTFEGYLLVTLQAGWLAFINYLPNLLTIILVSIVTYFLVRLSHPLFKQLSEGTFSLPGFYPEWAAPTHKLFTFLILALAGVIIFPLLPGFQSPAFQGISVFLGLLISLGSTSVISNLVSGSVLIYTRAFRVGDRIKIGEISGKVLETTLLVTRILTPTNVIVSIPNSQISTSSIENYSFAARELNQPLILRITVYLGYEVPWREAYQALTQAALRTQGFAKLPEPFVLQGELNEVFVTYLLNVYIDLAYFKDKTLKEVEQARSQLNENIRDCCGEAGIRIFAPSYEADPTNYGPAVDTNI